MSVIVVSTGPVINAGSRPSRLTIKEIVTPQYERYPRIRIISRARRGLHIGGLARPPGRWDLLSSVSVFPAEPEEDGKLRLDPVDVSATFVFAFVLFGSLFPVSGAGAYIVRVAFSILERFRGGRAKASVLACGFMGSIAGSSVANTVVTRVVVVITDARLQPVRTVYSADVGMAAARLRLRRTVRR